MIREVWTDIPGYEGLYQLSNLDKVRSLTRKIHDSLGHKYTLKGKEKKLTLSNNRYLIVLLHKKGKAKTFGLHQLKLITYVGSCPEGMEACHSDGNSLNNELSNLRWDTPTNNQRDRELHETTCNDVNHRPYRLRGKVEEIIELFLAGHSTTELAKRFNTTIVTIGRHIRKRLGCVPRNRSAFTKENTHGA